MIPRLLKSCWQRKVCKFGTIISANNLDRGVKLIFDELEEILQLVPGLVYMLKQIGRSGTTMIIDDSQYVLCSCERRLLI